MLCLQIKVCRDSSFFPSIIICFRLRLSISVTPNAFLLAMFVVGVLLFIRCLFLKVLWSQVPPLCFYASVSLGHRKILNEFEAH